MTDKPEDVDPKTRQRIVAALREGRVAWAPRAADAISRMNLTDPDRTIRSINVSFWGKWRWRWWHNLYRRARWKRWWQIWKVHPGGNDGGMSIDWTTESAGCGSCTFYIKDCKLHCDNEAMGDRFIMSLFEKMLTECEFSHFLHLLRYHRPPSGMTNFEFSLFVRVVQLTMQDQRNNPDVGIGPSWDTIARRAADSIVVVDGHTFAYPDESNKFTISDVSAAMAAEYCQYVEEVRAQ